MADLRAQLLAVLWDAPYDHEDQVDALLPVVTAYAAEQLRELARGLEAQARAHAVDYPGAFTEGLEAAAVTAWGAVARLSPPGAVSP